MSSTLQSLRQEYERTFAAMVPDTKSTSAVNKAAKRLLADKSQYERVSTATGIPWGVVAVIHWRKGGAFDTHLHNSDPLTARTRAVPADRPRAGEPPFEWWQSAADALRFKKVDDIAAQGKWGIAEACFAAESWNGWGYRNMNVPSAYLWAGSSPYKAGFYGADGYFDRAGIDPQPGTMVVLARLLQLSPDALGQKPAPEPVSIPPKGRFTMPNPSPTVARLVALGVALLFGVFALAGAQFATPSKPVTIAATKPVVLAAVAPPLVPAIAHEPLQEPLPSAKLPEKQPDVAAIPPSPPPAAPAPKPEPPAAIENEASPVPTLVPATPARKIIKTPPPAKKRWFVRKVKPEAPEPKPELPVGDFVRNALSGK